MALGLVKERVIWWTKDLANRSLGREEVLGVRDALSSLRAGLAAMPVRAAAGGLGVGWVGRAAAFVGLGQQRA